MDLATAKQLHRELWDWLAETGSESKANWPRWKWNFGDIEHVSGDCFACEYCGDECMDCPIEWGAEECGKGLYGSWYQESDKGRRAALAAKIRDLPWREIDP